MIIILHCDMGSFRVGIFSSFSDIIPFINLYMKYEMYWLARLTTQEKLIKFLNKIFCKS